MAVLFSILCAAKMGTAVILLITAALVSASVVPEPRPPQRIVGGEVTTIQSYPFGSSLLFSTDLLFYQQWCGGAIINNRSILSAAHCFYGRSPAQWRSRVGSTWANSGGTVINTQQILIYPGYEHHILDNDVAILRTATTINYITDTVQPGSISGVNYNLADNEIVWAIGWGTTSFGGSFSEQLRHVQIWTINQEICRSRYAELNLPITDSMLCAGWLDVGGRDQCSGDSGGPVLHNNVIVGICSWGFMCAHPRYPGVNARVSSYSAWIQANA